MDSPEFQWHNHNHGFGKCRCNPHDPTSIQNNITLAGTLAANINIILPAWRKSWRITNNTSGAFSITVKTISGTGVICPQNASIEVIGDGTNITLKTGTAASQNVGNGTGIIPDMSSGTSSLSTNG